MAKTVEFLGGARLDFDDSFDWYVQRSVGAACLVCLEVRS